MTDQELIQTTKQAMEDLWNSNNGKLLDYEQTAYNCLRLLCERLEETYIPAYATRDESSHWYVIPLSMKDEFTRLSDACEKEDYTHESVTAFENKFSEYRTGGSINLVQLYVKGWL